MYQWVIKCLPTAKSLFHFIIRLSVHNFQIMQGCPLKHVQTCITQQSLTICQTFSRLSLVRKFSMQKLSWTTWKWSHCEETKPFIIPYLPSSYLPGCLNNIVEDSTLYTPILPKNCYAHKNQLAPVNCQPIQICRVYVLVLTVCTIACTCTHENGFVLIPILTDLKLCT